jgi:hypothetical protein
MNLLETLMQQLSGGTMEQLGRQIGADPKSTTSAVQAAIPALLAGLSKNTTSAKGAESLFNALSRDHDGGILDDIAGLLGNTTAANGAGILKHVLGGQQSAVQQGLAGSTGLSAASIGKILEFVAPLVMGYLGKTQRTEGLDAGALTEFLGVQRNAASQSAPDIMNLVGGLLDQNKDGSIIDDLGKIAGKLFGGR